MPSFDSLPTFGDIAFANQQQKPRYNMNGYKPVINNKPLQEAQTYQNSIEKKPIRHLKKFE